jgi:hypothetical protein
MSIVGYIPEQAMLVSKPAAPPSGYVKFYRRTDGNWYYLDSADVEYGFSGANLISKRESFTFTANQYTITHASMQDERVVSLTGDTVDTGTLSNLASGNNSWEPLNRSTGDANINNGNLTDLVYNNSASGQPTGWPIGVD